MLNDITFDFTEKISDFSLIDEFEKKSNYKFPLDFKRILNEINGGSPSKSLFDTQEGSGREIAYFLSFNKNDDENIWFFNDFESEELSNKFVAFADDNFGNLICFDKTNNNIVFLDMETYNYEIICDSFSMFLNILYE